MQFWSIILGASSSIHILVDHQERLLRSEEEISIGQFPSIDLIDTRNGMMDDSARLRCNEQRLFRQVLKMLGSCTSSNLESAEKISQLPGRPLFTPEQQILA